MSTQSISVGSVYSSASSAESVELFPSSVAEVFDRLNCIADCNDLYEVGETRPSPDTVKWAKRVLLRVVPRRYLLGAEIDAFHAEVHVTWEHGNKRLVAFLPSPNVLKLYLELIRDNGEVQHFLRPIPDDSPFAINDYLKWMYA